MKYDIYAHRFSSRLTLFFKQGIQKWSTFFVTLFLYLLTGIFQYAQAADTTPPTINSIVRQTPASSYTNADSVVFRITFSEDVQNVSTGDFTLSGTAAGDGSVNSVSTVSASSYDVTITGLTSSNGTVNLDVSGSQNIADLVLNALVNLTPTGADETYTIDNIAPSAPSAPNMTTGTDLGSSNSDNLTSDSTPTFTGTSEASATITLISSVDGTVGSTTADGSGNWSVTASTLTEGAHNMTAVATDAAGNTSSASSALAINIDLTAPSAPSTPDMTSGTDTGSSNTDNITGDNTPTFTGTAVASTVVSLISSVDGIVGTTTADGSGNWSITAWSSMTEGGHNMTAVSSDSAGNVSSASSALSITIDTSAPAAPSTPNMTAGTDTGSSSTDNYTADTTPTFTGTAEANTSMTLVSSVDGVIATTTADGSGNWSMTAATLTEGAHNITAFATDTAGNTSVASSALPITIDITNPSAPSAPDMTTGTDLGSSNNDNLTSDSTPTFTGTSEASATITLISSVDGTVGSTTADGSGNWSVTASTLTEGAHNMSAVATDAAGNTSVASSTLAINIDLTAPSAPSTPDMTTGTDTGSSNTDNITGDNTPTFTGTAVAGTVVSLISSVDGIVGTDTADGSGNWSITAWSSMTEGGHNMSAVSSDSAGNVSSASSALSITIDTSAPSAPSTPNMTAGTDTGSSSTDNYTADTTPTFTGTSEASASMTLISSVDGVIATTTSDGSGNWSMTAASLTEGAHNITAVVTDTAGNTSVASSALAITIDTTNPSAPSAPDMTTGTDLGSSNSDNLTSDSTPTFTGSSEANATITLISSVDGTVGSTTADGSGNWSVTASTLTEGAHNMSAVATDAAGNTSVASSALAINIDLTAPSAPSTPDMTTGTDTGSSNTDNITGDSTPTFTGTAVAGTVVSLISSVDGIVGTDTADGSGNWSITAWSSMTEGGHNMSAVSSDAAGNVSSASSALSITVDTSAPAAPSTPNMSAGSDTGSSSTDNNTADTTPTFTGTAVANSSVTLISSVDGVIGTASADGSGNWSITAATLTEGAHNITAVATDTAGNTSVASSALSITIDTTNPSAPSAPDMTTGTDLGSSNSDNLTSDSTPTFTGTSEASATITLISSVDGAVGSTTADGSGNWSVTASTLTEGAHNMSAVATDAAGNTSVASSALAINIDLTAPSAPSTPDMTTGTDTGSSNTDNITGDNTPTFTGTAVAGTVISLISSVDGIVGTDTADGSGNWSITAWSSMTEGGHNMSAVSSDSAGNVSSASSALSITIDTSAPAAPSTPNMTAGTDTGSSSTDNYTADTTPTFTGTSEASASITLISSVDGVVGTTSADGSGNWSITAASLTEGAHNITATATDTAGNTSVASSTLAITIDTTNPSAPSAPDMTTGTDLGSSNSDNLTSDNTPTFTGTSEASATITLISSVDGTVGSTTADGSGNWSVTASTLTEGAHNMSAVATDAAGNTSSASSALAINIDLTAPSAPSMPDMTTGTDTGSSNTDNITGDNAPTFTGTAVAGTVVSLISSVDGIVGTDTADGSGNWSITAWSSMTEGGHNMSAVSSDAAGNVSSASSALSITIDTTGPGTASGTLAVDENASNGTSVGTVTATDAISYALADDAGGRFAIGSGTGAVTVADGSLLNYETNASHSITVRTTDVAANITDTPLSVTINDINDAPTITSTAITSANEDSAYSYTFTVDDEDSGGTLTLSAPTLPAWLSFNSTTGVLSGTPVNADVGPHSVLLRVNDGSVDVDQEFTITVNNTNDAPVVSGTPETRAVEGVAYSFTISATDVDVGDSVTYVIANNPAWLGIDSGTGVVSGTPGVGDVGSDTGILVGAYDGTTTTYLSAFDITVVNDMDNDGIGDDLDPDIDGDGMSNVYEDANGLDKYDAGDRDTDLDGDGVSNYDESVAGSNANADDYPPVVTPPADITVDATGLFTQVDVGTASATDALDGEVSASSDSGGYFKPGVNTVTWTATDAASNSGTATQTVNVVPMVNFSKDQNASEGGSATIRVVLNGTAVTYPVTVPYTVSGTANGADHDLVDGSATITGPNLEATITVNLVNDGTGEGTETLVVTMGTPVNAVVGPKSTHTISIYESNVSPMVDLAATQASVPTRIVEQGGANVVVTATVDDPNPGDTHTYDWGATDNALVDLDATAGTFTFSPDTVGIYTLRVSVTDSGSLSSDAVLTIRVVSALPTLGTSDSDSDGIDDTTEGSGDADNDGIADYLDNADLQQNTLQELSTTADSFLIETEPGLTLQQGDVAFRADHGSASVTEAEIQTHANGGAGAVADSDYTYSGGLFDYAVHGLSTAGQSVVVVIPQFDTIPANAVYRKLTSSGWQDFVVDANNTVSSAAGAEGYCPPPGDAAYSSGLTEGHWCVQLSIEDGGPNDADDTADQKVEDPGGVTVSTSIPVSTSGHSGGGGGLGWWALMALLLVLATNYHKLILSRRHRV